MTNDASSLIFLYALTPAHPGTGQMIGAIDLPIQREAQTNLPVIQASSVKGAWRSSFEQRREDPALIDQIFGPTIADSGNSRLYAGALSLTDARLLAFPARSAVGLIAWLTSPFAWARLRRDAKLAGIEVPAAPALGAGGGVASGRGCVMTSDEHSVQPAVVVEAYRVNVTICDHTPHREDCSSCQARQCAAWLAQWFTDGSTAADLEEKLIFVDDDLLRDVTIHGAEISARVSLDTDGTVKEGPWYEELMPADTVLYALSWAGDYRMQRADTAGNDNALLHDGHDVMRKLAEQDGTILQIGGGATIGRGIFHVRIHQNAAAQPTTGR